MLVIRREQMAALQGVPRRDVENRFIAHFSRYYPGECHSAGERNVRRLVQTGIDRASSHGFLTIDTAGLYINLMIILGSDFDSDPQLGWAQSQLADYSCGPPERIQRLFQSTLDYLDKVVGPKGEHIVRAMLRIRKHDCQTPWHSTGEEFERDLAALLADLYPEKAAFQGDEANRALIRCASQAAAEHGLGEPHGTSIYVTLAFMLGIGFATDPIYWWAGEALAESEDSTEAERASRLLQRSLAHVEESLRGQSGR